MVSAEEGPEKAFSMYQSYGSRIEMLDEQIGDLKLIGGDLRVCADVGQERRTMCYEMVFMLQTVCKGVVRETIVLRSA